MTDRQDPVERHVFELRVLNEIGAVSASAKTSFEILSRTTQLIASSLFPDNCGFLIVDQERQVLVPHRSFVMTNPEVVSAEIPLSAGLTGKTARTGRPWRVGDVQLDPDYLKSDSRSRSELCLPLRVQKAVFGVFNIESSQPDAFSEADERLMIAVLDVAGAGLERLLQQEKLQASEMRFQHMMESLPIAVLVQDLKRIHYANPMAMRILGVASLERLYQMSPFDLVAPAYRHGIRQRVQRSLQTKEPVPPFEAQVIRDDGTVLDVEVSSIWTEYDGADCVQLHFTDITQRKRGEHALAENEKKFRELADAIPQIVWIAGPDGGLTQLNAKATEYSGIEAANLTGWSWDKVIHPDDLAATISVWQDCLREGRTRDISFRIRRADGTFRWHITRQVPVHDDTGFVTTWYGTCTNIEDLKQAENVILKLSAFRETIIRTAAEGICVCFPSPEFPFVTFSIWNDRMTEITGYSLEEINRLGWYQSLYPDPEVQEKAQRRMERMRVGDDLRHEEWEIACKDGTHRVVSISTSSVELEDGVQGVAALIHDVTDRHQADAARQAALEDLQKSEERFSKLFHASPFSIIVASYPEGQIVEANEAFLKLFGFQLEEVIGRTTGELGIWVHSSDRQRMLDSLSAHGAARNMEYTFRTKGGRIFFLVMSVEIIRLDGREFSLAMSIDITDRKMAEQALRQRELLLRESDQRLRLAIQATNVGPWDWNIQTGKVTFSDEWKRQFGYDRHELDDRFEEWENRLHPEDRTRVHTILGDYLAQRRLDYEVEFRMRHRDGTYRWIYTRGEATRDQAGRPVHLFGCHLDITDRKMAELAIRESEERYRKLFETSGDGIFILDLNGTIRSANPAAAKMHGYALEEIIGRNMRDLDVPGDANQVSDRMLRIMSGETLHFEVAHYCKDNSEIVLDVIATPLPLADELLVLAFDRDITERKRMENTLRHILEAIAPASGEDYFQSLVNHLSRVCQMDFAFIGAIEQNETAVRTLAVSMRGEAAPDFTYSLADTPCEGLLRTDFCRYPHSIRQLFPNDQLLVEMGIESYLGIPLKSKDGRTLGLLVLLDGHPVSNTQHAETLLQVVARQAAAELERAFAEKSRAEAIHSLQESETFLRMSQEAAHIGSWEWDPGTKRLKWSEALAGIYGLSVEEFDGTIESAVSYCDAESAGRFETFLTQLCGGHTTEGVEFRIHRRDGTSCDLWFVGQIRSRSDGVSHNVIGVGIDITDRKREESHRQLLASQLAQAQKLEAIGRLAGGVAHDFNNILIVINGYAQLLLASLPPADPQFRMLTEIAKAGERAATLTQQLLNYSRKQVPNRRALDLNREVNEMETMLRKLIGENIALKIEYPTQPTTVMADAGQIGQVVMNLIVNARDAMPDGGVLTVTIDTVEPGTSLLRSHQGIQPGRFARIRVVDKGCGIQQELLERIFEPFFTTKGVGAGTGLGLASVRAIAEEGGGFVHVHSIVGYGSTFEFYLPAIIAMAAESPVLPHGESHGRETILIVEDEAPVRSVMRLFLERDGYTVHVAAGALEALQVFELHEDVIDFLVTDVVMPEMNGRELVSRILKRKPEMKYLFVSGYSTDDIVRQGVLDSRVELLQKPFSPGVLTARVRAILDQVDAAV